MKQDENVVAVLDILGYSLLMERLSIDDVERLIRNGLLQTLDIARRVSGEAIAVGEGGALEEMDSLVSVEYGVVSDTIVLFPRVGTRLPLTTLCSTVSILMTQLLSAGILLRGAIAVDTFRALKGHAIYIGKALISAHELEMAQDWSGCTLSKRIGRKFPKEFPGLCKSGLVLDYPIPFKKNVVATEHWAINWFHYKLGNQVDKVNTLIRLRNEAPTEARQKVVATVDFWEFLNQNDLNWRAPLRRTVVDRTAVQGPYKFAPQDPTGTFRPRMRRFSGSRQPG